MKFTKGDIMSLDETLSPIILAGLIEFKEALLESKYGSYPAGMLEIIGAEGFNPTTEEDEACWEMWLEIVDKMVYAFDPEEEPNMDEYGFEFEWKEEPETGQVSIDITDQSEYDRYMEDKEIWERKCKEGRLLFAEYFHNLWI